MRRVRSAPRRGGVRCWCARRGTWISWSTSTLPARVGSSRCRWHWRLPGAGSSSTRSRTVPASSSTASIGASRRSASNSTPACASSRCPRRDGAPGAAASRSSQAKRCSSARSTSPRHHHRLQRRQRRRAPRSSRHPKQHRLLPHHLPARVQSPLLGTLILVPAGRFMQGSERREQGRRSNETLREVTISQPFYLAEREVTNGQFRVYRRNACRGYRRGSHARPGRPCRLRHQLGRCGGVLQLAVAARRAAGGL